MGDTFALHKQIEAAKLLREQLADITAGDPEFLRDMIEGETTLHEQICALTASEREDRALLEGLKALSSDLDARKRRIESRADTKRTLIALAMQVGELPKIETPAGTVTRKAVPPKAIITEESLIPTRFWVASDPKVDRKALTDALKARATALKEASEIKDEGVRVFTLAMANGIHPAIPGAELSNGGETIQIRT